MGDVDAERLLLVLKSLCLLAAFIGGRQLGMLYGLDIPMTPCARPPHQAAVVYIDDRQPCPPTTTSEGESGHGVLAAPLPASRRQPRLPATHPNSYFRRPVHADDSCPPTADPAQLQTHIHKNKYRRLELEGMGLHADGALKDVFGYLHHPSCPVYAEPVLVSADPGDAPDFSSDFSSCESVYAMRSGSRDDQPCKCVAVVRVPPGEGHVSEMSIMHRTGHIDWPQVLTDQYQDDIVHYYSLAEEKNLTSLFLAHRDELIAEFVRIMGPPIDEHGNVRTALLMVANAGVMDLVLNFLCSTAAAGIDMSSFVIFLGQGEYAALVRSMGAKSMYHPALGDMPAQSAERCKSHPRRPFFYFLPPPRLSLSLSLSLNSLFF